MRDLTVSTRTNQGVVGGVPKTAVFVMNRATGVYTITLFDTGTREVCGIEESLTKLLRDRIEAMSETEYTNRINRYVDGTFMEYKDISQVEVPDGCTV